MKIWTVKISDQNASSVQSDLGSTLSTKASYVSSVRKELKVNYINYIILGIQNNGIVCDACNTKSFTGTRWKCSKCDDYDLCTVCYFGDKHEITHPFIRIDVPGLKG